MLDCTIKTGWNSLYQDSRTPGAQAAQEIAQKISRYSRCQRRSDLGVKVYRATSRVIERFCGQFRANTCESHPVRSQCVSPTMWLFSLCKKELFFSAVFLTSHPSYLSSKIPSRPWRCQKIVAMLREELETMSRFLSQFPRVRFSLVLGSNENVRISIENSSIYLIDFTANSSPSLAENWEFSS